MITLKHNAAYAVINPDGGGWLESLSTKDAHVLFPKGVLRSESGEEKIRGGMHVCLPNFGPGGDSNLAQHGFGRMCKWTVANTTEDSIDLVLTGGSLHYAHLVSSLSYTLRDNSLEVQLALTNNGARPLRVAPAFHPYFMLDETETAIRVNGVTYELAELIGTEFISAKKVEFITANQTLQLSQSGLETWAIWTDQLGPYVCVEPTTGGYRFLEPETPDELLAPNETRDYSFTITW